MTLLQLLALAATLVILAALPSTSVALVVTRSATAGVRNGIAAAVGIVLGDLVFVALALVGMTALAESLGSLFVILRILAGLYLVWLGISLLRARPETTSLRPDRAGHGVLAADVAAGLFLTLGDLKAILFYASLFPVFVDLTALTATDILLLVAITALAVGGVKLAYALLARRVAVHLHPSPATRWVRRAVGGLITGAGVYLVAKP